MVLRQGKNSRRNTLICLFLLPNLLLLEESLGGAIHRGQPHLSRRQSRAEKSTECLEDGLGAEEEPAYFLLPTCHIRLQVASREGSIRPDHS